MEFQYEPPQVKEPIFFPFLHQKMLNLAERSKKRCVEIKKNGAAGSCCMDRSYFRFLFQLARNPNNLDCPNPKKVWLKGM